MQSSKEQQGEIREPSSMINAKKQRKTIEWERLQRSLQENQRYQGNISCKDEHNKGQKQYGPKKAEDIKKRRQEYTELYKKDLHDPDNHNIVITHLEPDILECEIKWALESITMNKGSGGDGFQLSYFKSWKMML